MRKPGSQERKLPNRLSRRHSWLPGFLILTPAGHSMSFARHGTALDLGRGLLERLREDLFEGEVADVGADGADALVAEGRGELGFDRFERLLLFRAARGVELAAQPFSRRETEQG